MDEEERQKQLKAGKQALLEFQQKKKKKKGRSKKAPEAVLEGNVSTNSEPPSLNPRLMNQALGATEYSQDNGLSLDPFEHHTLEEHGLPYDEQSTRLSTSLPIMPNLTNHDENLPTVDQSDGPSPSHDLTRVSELEQQLASLTISKQQLQNELNSVLDQHHQAQNEIQQVRENQAHAIDIAKRDIASRYESQISSLQHSLMQSETAQQNVEKQLFELKSAHSVEIEDLLKKQEEIRLALLAEKDQKHAEHVARLTENLASQIEASTTVQDTDEQEAERLKMIKTKMREMFEEEKKLLISENEQEKVSLQKTSQQQIESYRVQTEQLANAKIQEIHAQFMTAHQTLLEQKNMSESQVQDLNSRLAQVESSHSQILDEKSDLQLRYDQLSEAHLKEIEKARHTSSSLESMINDWKEKASKLESRIHKSESQTQIDLESLREENEFKLQAMKQSYENQLLSLKESIDEYSGKLAQVEAERDGIAQGLTQANQEALKQIELDHTQEIDALNQSIRELQSEKGSLEVAEEHMKTVSQQLANYRQQEVNFQNQLDEKEREYHRGIESFKEKFAKDKHFEVQQVTAKFDQQIKTLEDEIASLTASVESGDTERRHQEKIESIRTKHKQRMADIEKKHEELLASLREKLELEHSQKILELTSKHEQEVTSLREEMSQGLESQKAQVVRELETVKQAEIQKIIEQHEAEASQKVNQSIVDEISSKSEAQIAELGQALKASKEELERLGAQKQDIFSQLEIAQRQIQELNQDLQRTQTENERLSKDCDRFQNSTKSLEVDLSISQSASERDKQEMATLTQQMEEIRTENESLAARLEEAQRAQESTTENEQLLSRLTNDLAGKNVAVADLQARNDTLNTEVFSLTQKCQELVLKTSTLQEQLETSWGANEEIDSLKRQVSELIPLKDEVSGLRESIATLEDKLASKDEAVMSLEAQLEQATKYVSDANTRCSETEKTLTESVKAAKQLEHKLSMKEGQEKELQKSIQGFEEQVEDLSQLLRDSEAKNSQQTKNCRELKAQLGAATQKVQDLESVRGQLENEWQQSKAAFTSQHDESYKQVQTDFELVCAEKDRLASELASVSEQQKQKTLEHNAAWEYKISQLENELEDVKSKLADKELEIARLQNEFSQKLKEAQIKSPEIKFSSTPSKERFRNISKEKSILEETLSKARIALTEKLGEKSSLERELSVHRIELERRLSEKKHLEELLAEKSRFEQELQNQKELLQSELEVIESKIKRKVPLSRDGSTERREESKSHHKPKSKHKKKK